MKDNTDAHYKKITARTWRLANLNSRSMNGSQEDVSKIAELKSFL